jgi:hypothetical protein
MLGFPGGLELPNVSDFYDEFLTRTPLPMQDNHYVSYVHGDLNAANILIDAHDNVWVIDFFHAGPGHVLKDLAKFENDLLYLLTPIEDASQLLEALAITRALHSVADLQADLPDRPDEVRSPQFVRAWQVLQVLRGIGGQLCHEDRHPLQLQVALLRYAVHTLSFPEASPLQKQSALAAACSLADQVTRTVEAELTLRVDWIEPDLIGAGQLGITLCPGRRDRGRDLGTDLAQLRAEGTTRLLCLLTDSELHWAGVPDLGPTPRPPVSPTAASPSPTRAHRCRRRHRPRSLVSRGDGARRGSGGDLHGRARPERNDCGVLPGRRRDVSRSGHRRGPDGAQPPRA